MFVWSRQAIGKIQTRGPTPYTYIPYTTLFRSRSLQESGITATFFASYLPPFYTNRGAADFARKLIDLILFETQRDRKSTRLNSSHGYKSYAVFNLNKKDDFFRQ